MSPEDIEFPGALWCILKPETNDYKKGEIDDFIFEKNEIFVLKIHVVILAIWISRLIARSFPRV